MGQKRLVSLRAKVMLGMRKKEQHSWPKQVVFCKERGCRSPLGCVRRGSRQGLEGLGEPCSGCSWWRGVAVSPGPPQFVLMCLSQCRSCAKCCSFFLVKQLVSWEEGRQHGGQMEGSSQLWANIGLGNKGWMLQVPLPLLQIPFPFYFFLAVGNLVIPPTES